jgi:hypothetical protein
MAVEEVKGGEGVQSFSGPDISPVKPFAEKEAFDPDEFYERIVSMVDAKIAEALEELLAMLLPDLRALLRNPNDPLHIKEVIKETIIDSTYTIGVFEVQEASTGDGVYNCYLQDYISACWTDTTGADRYEDHSTGVFEVMNLLENDPVAAYTPALCKYDRMLVIGTTYEWSVRKLKGIPITPMERLVEATEDAQDDNEVVCNVVLNNGAAAANGELGYHITVYGIINDGSTALNAAIPRITNTKTYKAYNAQGVWFFKVDFQASQDCT